MVSFAEFIISTRLREREACSKAIPIKQPGSGWVSRSRLRRWIATQFRASSTQQDVLATRVPRQDYYRPASDGWRGAGERRCCAVDRGRRSCRIPPTYAVREWVDTSCSQCMLIERRFWRKVRYSYEGPACARCTSRRLWPRSSQQPAAEGSRPSQLDGDGMGRHE